MGDSTTDSPDGFSNQICQVCGEGASGVYFGALVCLPCKTFFIRCTSELDQTFHCKSNGQCDIRGIGKRSTCKYCRFRTCQAVGMTRKSRPEVMEASLGQELCQVCGDLANGFHFGTFTCEGCKKFFARGEKEASMYSCKLKSKCTINPRTRNFCRYCRYQKCIKVGMSKTASKIGRPKKLGEESQATWSNGKNNEPSLIVNIPDIMDCGTEVNDPARYTSAELSVSNVSPVKRNNDFMSTDIYNTQIANNTEFKFESGNTRWEMSTDELRHYELGHGFADSTTEALGKDESYDVTLKQTDQHDINEPDPVVFSSLSTTFTRLMSVDDNQENCDALASELSILSSTQSNCETGDEGSPKDIYDLTKQYRYKDAEDYASKLSEMYKRLLIPSNSLTGENLHYLEYQFDNSYWLNQEIPKTDSLTDDQEVLLDKIIKAYDAFLQIADTEPPAMPKVWNGHKPDPSMADYISARIMLHVSGGITFLQSTPGIENISRADFAVLVRYSGIESGILTASCKWFNPQTRTFKHFYDMEIDPSDPSYDFKEATLDFAYRIYQLDLDHVECAVGNTLVSIASDFPNLQNPSEIEKTRRVILAALSAYINAKYGIANTRLQDLFSFMPALRRLGQWHYQNTMKTPLNAF